MTLSNDVLARRGDVLVESFDNVDVLFATSTGVVRKLNETATQIWRALAEPVSHQDLVAIVANPADTSSVTSEDAVRFIEELMVWQLIERVNGSFA